MDRARTDRGGMSERAARMGAREWPVPPGQACSFPVHHHERISPGNWRGPSETGDGALPHRQSPASGHLTCTNEPVEEHAVPILLGTLPAYRPQGPPSTGGASPCAGHLDAMLRISIHATTRWRRTRYP